MADCALARRHEATERVRDAGIAHDERARNVLPSVMRTPTARPDSTTTRSTSAEWHEHAARAFDHGRERARAIALAPPTGYHAPPR